MISFKDKQVKKIIDLLRYLSQKEKNKSLEIFITEIEQIYEEMRYMTSKETDEMVGWAVKNVK